jgi:hypothetical protein
MNPRELATRLYSEAAQENCDGPEYDLMQQAADCICGLIDERVKMIECLRSLQCAWPSYDNWKKVKDLLDKVEVRE